MTTPASSAVAVGSRLRRFGRSQRWVHRVTAALMGVCLATAAALYVGPVAVLVGHRALVALVHVVAGIALPVPFLVGLASRVFRADLGALNRFLPVDREWLRRRDRRNAGLPVGKFNAGQKLFAAFTAGAVLVMLGTGVIMNWPDPWRLAWRTGATFVHDWLALAVFVALIGHWRFAAKDPVSRAGLRTGFVPVGWARKEHRAWAEAGGNATGQPPSRSSSQDSASG